MSSFSDTPSLVAQTTILPYSAVKVTSAAGYLRNAGAPAASPTADFVVGVADGSTRKFDSANHAEAGDTIQLQNGDIVLAKCDGSSTAVVAGDLLKVTTDGVFVKAASGTAARVFAIALEPSAAAGTLIRAKLLPAPYIQA
jgi:hypothetical protein